MKYQGSKDPTLGEYMKNTMYTTLRIGAINGISTIYMPKILSLKIGDVIKVTCYKRDDPEKKLMSFTKKIMSFGGGGVGCYVNKNVGLKKGDVIVARLEYARKLEGENGIDPGVSAEEIFEKDFN